jgi:hypothetical protein
MSMLVSLRVRFAGKIVYIDSPLVRAALHGRVLMIDEADKAPLEVVTILKGLVEDGQLLLGDGRRIVSAAHLRAATAASSFSSASNHSHTNDLGGGGQIIPMHPDFKMIVLANKAGYPFLGNDFFREMGDVLSAHVVANPDPASELALLRAYAPAVDVALLRRLTAVFGDLRQSVDVGALAYPYSTRELVAIARHVQQFPRDGLLRAIQVRDENT